MLNRKFYLQHTVDIYLSELKNDKVKIIFHRMTTRERLEIITSKSIAEFLALLNGKRTVHEILNKLGTFNQYEAEGLINFLSEQHLITEKNGSVDLDSRYARQIAYLDDMLLDRPGGETQNILGSKKVVILGCGAVTGNIAETLTRAGILDFTLVDDRYFQKSNLSRHLFARVSDIGKSKVEVLANYLKNIDSRVKLTVFREKLLPHSDISKWVSDDIDLVINGCDEPYIGHTSIKLGRYLQPRNIPMYVMGGFDAHLMSSGELVYPPHTPCIDCIQSSFSKALSDWKPIYNKVEDIRPLIKGGDFEKQSSLTHNVGGSGGLSIMSGYSAFFSCLKIIQFLAEDSQYNFSTIRYEYLPNRGELTGFKLLKEDGCDVCDK